METGPFEVQARQFARAQRMKEVAQSELAEWERVTIQQETAPDLGQALISYADLASLDLPQRKGHLPWLAEGCNVMVFGPRGIGKSMLQLGLAASLTTGTSFLKWRVQERVDVLYVDGEMQLDELRRRITDLSPEPPKGLHFIPSEWVYHRLHRDLILTGAPMRDSLLQVLEGRPDIRVLILDNISCLFSGIDENSKKDWEPINTWLIRLRHRGIATVLVHHGGKGGQQRGTSGREDSLDTVIQLDRPADYDPREGCHFELKFTKCRSVKGEEVGPIDVKLEDQGGRLTWTWKPLEQSKEDQVRALLNDGIDNPSDIAEALGINRSYAWKLKKRIENAKKMKDDA